MAFMKNREKFAKEIMDITCSGSGIAMKKGVLVPCNGASSYTAENEKYFTGWRFAKLAEEQNKEDYVL